MLRQRDDASLRELHPGAPSPFPDKMILKCEGWSKAGRFVQCQRARQVCTPGQVEAALISMAAHEVRDQAGRMSVWSVAAGFGCRTTESGARHPLVGPFLIVELFGLGGNGQERRRRAWIG
jgi:hypothetical protein